MDLDFIFHLDRQVPSREPHFGRRGRGEPSAISSSVVPHSAQAIVYWVIKSLRTHLRKVRRARPNSNSLDVYSAARAHGSARSAAPSRTRERPRTTREPYLRVLA
jgi:hypothetical protein